MVELSKRQLRYRANKEHENALSKKWRHIGVNLTFPQYNLMLSSQGGKCAICKTVFTGTVHVDHDHKSGTVRALLCGKCNKGIGLFNDDVNLLNDAISYLAYHGAK